MSAVPWRGRVDGVLMAVLWVLATALNLALARASVAGGVLTGEEASVSFSYIVAIPEHVELSVYATNFAGHVFYWVASHLVPHPGLFYGRIAKAPFLALLAPLVLLVLRRRLGTGRSPPSPGPSWWSPSPASPCSPGWPRRTGSRPCGAWPGSPS